MTASVEKEFQGLTLSEMRIKPGLFHLPISINFQPDSQALNERRTQLKIQLEEEHCTTHLVIRNLIAIINHKVPRMQIEVREDLEQIIEQHPKHLNTLAFLEIIYRELYRRNDADRCKLIIESVLQSQASVDIQLQAQCVLEQGYALINEEASNHEGIANQNIRSSIMILSNENERSAGRRREFLGHALRHAENASSSILSAMFCDRQDEKLQRKKYGIKQIETGLWLLESIGKQSDMQYLIWKFCLGRADNRIDYSVYLQDDSAEKDESRSKLCGKVLQIFWDTITMLLTADGTPADDITLYIARSYAYIGHLLISRYDIKIVTDFNLSTYACFKNNEFLKLVERPLSCFEIADKLCPNNVHVLNRYGRSLRNLSRSEDSNDKKEKLLCHACEILSKSINIRPDSNWFAYVSRMDVHTDLAKIKQYKLNRERKATEKEVKDELEKARLDGLHCFNSKATEKELPKLANICQMLAKCPEIYKSEPKFVKDKTYINEAIHYLNYALHLDGFVNYDVTFTLGSCLFEIWEYRMGVEWMKRAMHLSRSGRRTICLTRVGEYILSLYQSCLRNDDKAPTYLFEELRYCFGFGKLKYPDVTESISRLCKFHKDASLAFTEYLMGKPDTLSRELAPLFLEYLKKWKREWEIKQLDDVEQRFKSGVPPSINSSNEDLPRSSEFSIPDFAMPFSVDASVRHSSYTYDFFVSHSNINRDWVNGFLLQQLETKLHVDDTAFKGCIADRDFTPGKTIIDNIVEAVAGSHKVILIITEEFLKSRWCDYEMDKALMDMLGNKKNNCIIPLILENVNIPEKINHITYLDLTDKSEHLQGIMKLKRALSADILSD